MKKDTVVILGVLAIGGYLLYRKSQAAALATSSPVVVPPMVNAPMSLPTTLTTGQQTYNNTPPSTPVDPNGVPLAFTQWAETLDVANKAQFDKMLPSMTPGEIACMTDIIINDFNGNHITTPAQRSCWDSWRVKYHILDGTFP